MPSFHRGMVASQKEDISTLAKQDITTLAGHQERTDFTRPSDVNQRGGIIENIEARVTESRLIFFERGFRVLFENRNQIGLALLRKLSNPSPVVDNDEVPGLTVARAGG